MSVVAASLKKNGMVYLKGLTNLDALQLGKPKVTDKGLRNLKGFGKLRRLFFQAEDGIRDLSCDWSSDVCSSDLSMISQAMEPYKRDLLQMKVDKAMGGATTD